jgi:glycerol-3-phosphate dehydrogenase
MGGPGLQDGVHDLAIIGGGINGCGIARDAQGRGLSVVLVEQGDLGGATSSASTKLIHGGLRYLEHFEFRLVREALIEREILLKLAPHIIRPMRFVLPHHKGLRPWPVIRLGLFLYDHLGGRELLPATRTLDLTRDAAGTPLKSGFRRAFEYSDCWVQDSRLVILNARDAADRGATILPQARCVHAQQETDRWLLTVENVQSRKQFTLSARALVNASGPWVSDVQRRVLGKNVAARVRLVKGSHIVVGRLFDHGRSYIFQNSDDRICFAIPYEEDFTLIGTTDEDYNGDPAEASISDRETDYLLSAVNEYFRVSVQRDAIRWTYSGVRPLYDDGSSKAQEATRDYELTFEADTNRAPLLSIFGGKITTYRRLAESALEKLSRIFPNMGQAWTQSAALPGGDFAPEHLEAEITRIQRRIADLPPKHAERLFRTYGTRASRFLEGANRLRELGENFGAGLSQREVDYLIAEEWARSADDILWRRTKLGLKLSAEQRRKLNSYVISRTAGAWDGHEASTRFGSASSVRS